jgi:D-arginine dehydrogenase
VYAQSRGEVNFAAMRDRYEVIVVGAGIAGASAAYFLRGLGGELLILEREEQPGYHSTGRSAAALVEAHREPTVRRLISVGAAFLRNPPPELAESPLLDPAGVLVPAVGADWARDLALARELEREGIRVAILARDEALALVPALEPAEVDGALLLPDDGHLDVHALHSGYLRAVARAGGELRCASEVRSLIVERGRCVGVATAAGELRARRVVNAAGAWAGELARGAPASAIALTPRRRTIILFDAPAGLDVRRWPMVDCEARRFYFKPESGGLLASPMDETAVEPCDARPAEEDVALAIDRLERHAPALVPRALRQKWAGLRTFAPDELPLVGEDPALGGLFWLAGQGGVGIETSPALGRIAAELILDGRSSIEGAAALSPRRFR